MSFNLHYADAAGHIAYFHRGTRRLHRPGEDPRLPFDGGGTMEWRGTVPAARMPTTIDPARGFITNWNNKPIAGWSAGEAREQWGVEDRVQVFIESLEAVRDAGGKVGLDHVKNLMARSDGRHLRGARRSLPRRRRPRLARRRAGPRQQSRRAARS